MTAFLPFALLPLALTAAALADLTPTAPGPGQSFKAGTNCTIQWNVDQTGTWKNVTIDLMSGSNNNMSFVANVAWDLDGTDPTLTPFNWTCPEVDPYAPIYFYQFTNGVTGNATWTTRFTIASPDGEHFPPTNATQPSGEPIPWGTGTLAPNATNADSGPAPSSSADAPAGDSSDDTADDTLDPALDSPSDSDSGSDTGPDDTAPTTDSLDQGSIAHPAQAAPVNLTTMDRHSNDRDGDSSDKGGGSDDSNDDKKDSRGDDGDSGDDDDGGDSSDGKADKQSDKSKSSTDSDGDDSSSDKPSHSSKSSRDHAKSSPAEEKGPTKSSSSGDSDTASPAPHKATGTARAQDDSDAETAKPSETGSQAHSAPKKTSSPAADPSATSADSAPTAALPPTPKKAHPTASASAGGLSASKAAHAQSSTNTCSCSPDQPAGLSKLLNGGASEVEKVSGWIHLVVPLVIAVLVLY